MCRFLIVQSNRNIAVKLFLTQFAEVVKNSKTTDGDWQGDGWGISWLDENNIWQVRKSLHPIWEENNILQDIKNTKTFVVHARSASFPQHKNNIAFNQPYISGKYAFVFNGLLKGVSLPNIPGIIGAGKIWHILQQFLQLYTPEQALEKTRNILIQNSQKVVAINMGLATKNQIYSSNYFTQDQQYYQLHRISNVQFQSICSEQIQWKAIDL